MDAGRLRTFWENADYFRVAEEDGLLAGFLVAFASDAPHDSPNFLWFRERYPQFLYVDRIVIAGTRRGAGVGRVFYGDVQGFAETRHPALACEVFLEDVSHPALLFHGSFGFREVGQHVMPAADGQPAHRAAMLMKELCSYAWVHDTYGGQLPDVPWINPARAGQARAGHASAGHADTAHRATGT
jgi:predicted GNAT superfamily acetyltransferase